MRRLGQELGVEAMSLYNHVANKDDILDGIVEIVLARDRDPAPDGMDWKEAIRRTTISSHETVHPPSLGVRAPDARAQGKRRADGVDGGRPPNAAPGRLLARHDPSRLPRPGQPHHGLHALAGEHAVRDQGRARRSGGGLPEGDSPDRYPYVIEHAEQHIAPSSPSGATEFEFGLELILDGLERLRGEPVWPTDQAR